MITLIEREREREQNRNSQSNKCSKCGKWADSLGKCSTSSCENYYKANNTLSKFFKKGSCENCGKSNIWTFHDLLPAIKELLGRAYGHGQPNDSQMWWICFNCVIADLRKMVQESIQKEGIKSAQSQWKELKAERERMINALRRVNLQAAEEFQQVFQTVERDLLYRKNKGSSAWIWVLVIVGVIVVGIISLVLWRKKKK